jgi:glutathione synthase
MDPIEKVNVAGDTTFALMLAAAERGHRLSYFTPDRLSLSDGRVVALVDEIDVRDQASDYFTVHGSRLVDLSTIDVVLLRQDPPFDLAYITSTHLLELLPPQTIVVNDPTSVRNAPEKLFVMNFPHLMPPTLIARDKKLIEGFCDEHGEVVMKPLFGHGGAAVFKISRADPNFGSLYDMFATTFREPWVVQRFIPEIERGDKRIILIDGVAAGAVNRVPAPGDIRSNLVRGGAANAAELTAREKEICTTIGPELSRRGLVLVGIDVINGYLTEINVTSPTGVRAIKRLGGPDLAAAFWDVVEAKRQAALPNGDKAPRSNWILRRVRGLGRRSLSKRSR